MAAEFSSDTFSIHTRQRLSLLRLFPQPLAALIFFVAERSQASNQIEATIRHMHVLTDCCSNSVHKSQDQGLLLKASHEMVSFLICSLTAYTTLTKVGSVAHLFTSSPKIMIPGMDIPFRVLLSWIQLS